MAGLRSIEGLLVTATEDGLDLDSVADFTMSSASAEQVTLQIRSLMERAWEYIAIAYQGRAHQALGYESWDRYVDDRLGDLRLTVPREQRGAVVQALSKAQMSLRVIAKVLGVSVATAFRDASAGQSELEKDDAIPITVQGRDGRQYRKRKRTAPACTICGEMHEEPPDQCPWDLFAQGRGPRPGSNGQRRRADVRCGDPSDGPDDEVPQVPVAGSVQIPTNVDSVIRAVCMVELVRGVRELIEYLRHQAGAIVSLANRLERITRTAESARSSRNIGRSADSQ
jgi:hypothetical protein